MPIYPTSGGFYPGPGGSHTELNLTSATQIVSGRATVIRVIVNTAPSAAGGVYDMASGGTASASNLIYSLSATGIHELVFPCMLGLYVDPGSGGVVSVSYSPL